MTQLNTIAESRAEQSRAEQSYSSRRFVSERTQQYGRACLRCSRNSTDTRSKSLSANQVCTCCRLGNIYGEQFGTGYAGNVYCPCGIAPAIMTMQGGGRQPHIIVEVRNAD